jgi:O-antigen/teichoic acid export membrane protein
MSGVIAVNYFLWEQAEVMFLGLYCPAEEVGFYTLASKLPFMIRKLIPTVLGAVLLPAIAEQYGKGDMQKLKSIYLTSSRYLMILSMPLATGGIALARPIVNLFYGAEYSPVITIMQILFVPMVIAGINQAANAVIYGINQPAFVLKMGGLLALLNVGLSLWLIPKYGMMGAVVASSVPRVLTLPVYIGFASRRIGATWPLWDTVKIALASLIMGLLLFVLQSHLGTVLALASLIPLGTVLYIAVILAFRVVRKQDLDILKGIESSLPTVLRKKYATLLVLTEKVVR